MASQNAMSELAFALSNSSSTILTAVMETTNTTTDLETSTVAASRFPVMMKSSTMSPGHAAILEMHANSRSNAIIYISVVLFLYIIGMSIVLIKYIRTERYEARLTRLFQDFVQREHFFRVSRRRRSSVPKNSHHEARSCLREELPHTSSFIIPDTTTVDIESKL